MTQAEYERLRDLILHTFPELHEHGARYTSAREGETQQAKEHRVATAKAQAERRRDALIGLDAADVRAAIDELRLAATVPWNEYGRQGQGFAMIGERARAIGKARRSATAEASEAESLRDQGRRRRYATSEGAPLMRASELSQSLIEARTKGECRTAAETRAWFDEHMPATARDESDQREWAKCTACRDTGLITVVGSLGRGRDGQIWWKPTSVACPCGEGLRYSTDARGDWKLPEYDDTEHVRIVSLATLADVQAEIARTKERRAKRNRVPGFDRHNEMAASGSF